MEVVLEQKDAGDWIYRGEGAANIVLTYIGSSPTFEGTNPIVVRSQDQRKKILSRERVKIKHGEIMELIPGHYYFKYVTLATEKNSSSPGEKRRTPKESCEPNEGEVQSVKRRKQLSDDEALARNLQSELYAQDNSVEAIRHFNVPVEKLPFNFPTYASARASGMGQYLFCFYRGCHSGGMMQALTMLKQRPEGLMVQSGMRKS